MLTFVMPTPFTQEDVQAIAVLAELALEPSEVELFARQLGDILAYAEEVQAVDTTGIPPTSHVATRHVSDRPDQVHLSLDSETALANAPDRSADSGLFKVPRVIG